MRLPFLLPFLLAVSPLLALETNITVRDPSTIVRRGDTYWVYGTGTGVRQFSSTDRIHWKEEGPVFPKAPPWMASTVPANKNNIMWAPDIHFFNGLYHLYYSVSSLGSNQSAIGVAVNATLNPKTWSDRGVVIPSTRKSDFNAIDPCLIIDTTGKLWMTYGSYWSGLKMTQLDPRTGKRPPNSKVYLIASRGTPPNAIEASAIYFHDGFYYLFVNWEGGPAYNIRMGRSKNVTGPFLDKNGRDLMKAGGTIFASSVFNRATKTPEDDQCGPGHVGILKEGDEYWVSTHYEWNRKNNGATTMNVNKLAWDSDGWPRFVLDPGPFKIVSALSTHGLVSIVKITADEGVQIQALENQDEPGQKWMLDHLGDGYYSIINPASGKALGIAGDSAEPGAKAEIAPFTKSENQQWFIDPNEDGTHLVLTRKSGKKQSLDISGCHIDYGTIIGQWTLNGAPCQRWSFRYP